MAEPDERLLMLIDDQPGQARLISTLAAREGWRTVIARDGDAALTQLGSRQAAQIHAIVLDSASPGDDACVLIAQLKLRRPGLPIVMLTASSSPVLAVEAMRAGATDYLIKPVAPDRLLSALRNALARAVPAVALQPLTEKIPSTLDFDTMVGTAPAFRAALAVAAKAARATGPVLIEGESGTGKETLVRAIHAASPRARGPLRIVNAGAIPANQIESVLFGHEQGAFAGAFERQSGALVQVDGGTLVIDEIDRLPAPVQERVVQFLARNEVRPMGARHATLVDVRLLACSNTLLADLADSGLFRRELVEALGPWRLHLPPLRERSGDLAALVRHFLARIGEQPGLRPLGITDAALTLLKSYDWPGNVRQLQAALFRAAVFCEGQALTPDDFPNLASIAGDGAVRSSAGLGLGSPRAPDGGTNGFGHGSVGGAGGGLNGGPGVTLYTADGNLRPLDEIEADVIRLAIGHYRGRMTEVARRLGIGRSTLYRKLTELGIDNAA